MQSSPGELGHQHDGVTDEDNVAVISPRSLLVKLPVEWITILLPVKVLYLLYRTKLLKQL